jgi:hypothetical protein
LLKEKKKKSQSQRDKEGIGHSGTGDTEERKRDMSVYIIYNDNKGTRLERVEAIQKGDRDECLGGERREEGDTGGKSGKIITLSEIQNSSKTV